MINLESSENGISQVSESTLSGRSRVGSNIGVRRQQAHSSVPSLQARQSIPDEGQDDSWRRRMGQGDSTHPKRRAHLHNPSSQVRPGHLKRGEPQRRQDEPKERNVKSVNSQSPSLKDASSSSGDDSTSTILINPDLQLLPVVKTNQARASFDYHINSYVTSIIEVSPQSAGTYPSIVHQILHDELLFTAFTTCSEAARWRTQSLYDDPPINVAKGYGKTISLLSERIRSEKFAMSPTVLLTMGQLTAIETLIKNTSATARHLAGMQSIMKAKNGTAGSGGSSPVQAAVDVWSQYFMHRAAVKSQIRRDKPLNYPHHPFNPQLSIQISELPLGFADVALSGRLSTEMLALLSRFEVYFKAINRMIQDGISDSPERTLIVLQQAAYCIEYFQLQHMTLIERLILGALTAYVVRRDRVHPALINMRNYFQITCAYSLNLLNSSGTSLRLDDQESFLTTWVGLMLLLTSTPEAHARKLALKLLPSRPEPLKTLKKCQEFFWDDDLTHALLSGGVITTTLSNDIIADNVKQALPEEEG